MFVLDDAGHLARIHPLEGIQTSRAGAHDDLIHQIPGLVLTQCRHQRLAHEVFAADTDIGVLLDIFDKLAVHRRHPLMAEILHGGHGHTEALYLLGLKMTEDLGGIILTETQHQHGRHLHAIHVIQDLLLFRRDLVLALYCGYRCHLLISLSTHSLTTWAARSGSLDTRARTALSRSSSLCRSGRIN